MVNIYILQLENNIPPPQGHIRPYRAINIILEKQHNLKLD